MPPKRVFLDDRLYVQCSTIPNAGKGLFARKIIRAGSFIGKYIGDVITDPLATDSDYLIETLPYIDANGKRIEAAFICGKRLDNKMRWINDPRYDKRRINARTVQTHLGEVEVHSTRTIRYGEEILMSYGEAYWKEEEARKLRLFTD